MRIYRILYYLVTFALFFFFFSNILFSQSVTKDFVKDYADKFMQDKKAKSFSYSEMVPFQKDEVIYTYVVNYSPQGWVLITGDKRLEPILAYSTEGNFDIENIEELPFYFWFDNYKKQIQRVIKSGNKKQNPKWGLSHKTKPQKENETVEPLLETKWNQNSGWNDFCPEDESGPGGRVYAGCVAVAMGQIMNYHAYPDTGKGSKTIHTEYGALSANFSDTKYEWHLTDPTSPNEHTALILYHLGIAVDMNYDPDGSGAFSKDVPAAIRNYFRYTNKAKYYGRENFEDSEWIDMLKNELYEDRPLYYAGNSGTGEPGHAFNIDGVDGDNRFHFNWGWSGSYDGYYYLESLSPGSNNFTENQQVVINFRPINHEPVDIYLSNNVIKENLPPGSVVGELSAEDETPEDEHTFEVRGPINVFGFPVEVPFAAEDNLLVITDTLDYEKRNRYEIIVDVTDLQGHELSKTFFIDVKENITDTNNTDTIDTVADLVNIDNPKNLTVIPGRDFVKFSFNNDYIGEFTVNLYDITGRNIIRQTFNKNMEEYSNYIYLDQQYFKRGVYILSLEIPSKNGVSEKIILGM